MWGIFIFGSHFLNALGKPGAAAESLSAGADKEPLGCYVGQ